MKKYFFLLTLICFSKIGQAQNASLEKLNRIQLPNGWSLSPAGKSLPLGDFPLNMAVSSSKKYMAVTNNGQGKQSIQLINIASNKIVDYISIGKSWLGIVFSKDEKNLYVAGGNDNWILKYEIKNEKLILADSIKLGNKWPTKISPTGICINDQKNILYVVTKDDSCLYEINLTNKNIIKKTALPAEAYTCALSNDKSALYITIWGDEKLLIYNTTQQTITGQIKTGTHPNDFCISKNGKIMYVANGEDNSVSVIDIKNKKVIETLNSALYPDAPTGSATNGIALSEDQKTLYIANADNNCLAVFDVSKQGSSTSKGFIPVGWYPTCVKVIGTKIYVANGKGFSSFPNPMGPDPYKKNAQINFQKGLLKNMEDVQYIGGLMKGTLSIINVPSSKQLGLYAQAVYQNTPYSKKNELLSNAEKGSVIPQKVGETSPIKHVFYIIKENRTYDQVLGDVKEGNGDTSLCLFGERITPNLHALAKEFVLLDNFYVDGEVSADGHNWSMGGYANDYLEKNWVTSYGGRGGGYDAEGTRAIANNKNGFIWDFAKRAGVSYRTYGEFADNFKANIPVLKNHFCTYYTSWDQKVRDTTRVGQWKRDFDSLLAINAVPQLNTLRIINDHTEGMKLGSPSPYAHVADNDLAVGMFIEYLSKSSIWNESVVFVLEDDAQNGPDHVDAHRSPAFVAGGLVKRNFIDHTMYSTSSILKTIELILGMPPMSQYDAAATPLWRCFNKTPIATGFLAKPLQYDINEKNTALTAMQRKSELFNFKKEDSIDDLEFTEVLWKGLRGENAIVPAPKRAAFIKVNPKVDSDD
ncbi:MAG: bifunctional YncE family protein/alkaline phosphatase family protein [Chitinophagia bacterium]